MSQPILKIALDIPLNRLFDYLDGGLEVAIGQRVVVPFGHRSQVGIVIDKASSSDVPSNKLKAITSAISQEPLLDQDTFALLKFCSNYYQYPFGQALLSSLPTRLRQITPAVARKQYMYMLTPSGQTADTSTIPAKKIVMHKLLHALQNDDELSEKQLKNISSSWRKAIDTLMEKNWVKREQVLAGFDITEPAVPAPPLNDEQSLAVDTVIKDKDTFKPFLLHGITGSGKTEVYMQILQQVLENNDGQALVLVPEINLTPQLEARFRSRLPHLPLVSLHSNLGESERLQNWRLAQSGKARIIIGTRLAVFTPIPKLKIVMVDEEHDGSYKQQDSMRYHARDVAIVRAKRRKIPIVMGSATPALETWHNAQSKKYTLLSLNDRAVSKSNLPKIRCINTTQVESKQGLTPALVKAMKSRLEKGEQSLLFINRRGYSPVLLCNACYWIAPCMRCSARLVVHLKQGRLRCHHCNHEQKIVRQCPSCGNADLHPTGHGTQRLEETLAELLPEARITRVDRDSVSRKDALSNILDAVHEGKVDILIGTQMLAKGHDFPNLTLVGVIDTDSALFSPDFRASERLFAQLMQVSGRAGRAEKAGEVLIQTAFPEHHLFNALAIQDYPSYATNMLQEREMTQFPPYCFLAIIRAEASNYSHVQTFLNFAFELARDLSQQVLTYDPMRSNMERLKGMERGQILMQAEQRGALQQLLAQLVPQLRDNKISTKIRWSVDVDPLEI